MGPEAVNTQHGTTTLLEDGFLYSKIKLVRGFVIKKISAIWGKATKGHPHRDVNRVWTGTGRTSCVHFNVCPWSRKHHHCMWWEVDNVSFDHKVRIIVKIINGLGYTVVRQHPLPFIQALQCGRLNPNLGQFSATYVVELSSTDHKVTEVAQCFKCSNFDWPHLQQRLV